MTANKTFDEIRVGDQASLTRVCTANDLFIFAHASGNLNPLHLPKAHGDGEPEAIAPSMWVGSLFSALLGNVLPGVGTLYQGQTLRFHDRARVGDELTATVRVTEKKPKRVVLLETRVSKKDSALIADGYAEVIAPEKKLELEADDLPNLILKSHQHFDRLLDLADDLDPLPTAVVCPEEEKALGGALLARARGLIEPLLVGASARIRETAEKLGKSLSGIEIIEAADHGEAGAKAVALAHAGRASALMKGYLHTDELLRHVVKSNGGLRTSRRVSHAFVMDVPGLNKLLLITDAAINISRTLEDKVDIVQNAIDLAVALGISEPRVGVLSAVETVNTKIPSTLDAAVLSKMAERGQIKGGLVDGPLAMDNAIDIEAARTKGVTSLVAGRAEVLVAPNLEAGNMLAKELTFVANAECAGLVLGARVPVILTSRADSDQSRLDSCAVAVLYQHWRSTGQPAAKICKEAAA
ncbi:MAG: bifunctional enoyl-CoA hydratase/phosphate acetyltransferase [Gammaproteobacteria bacterium]